jgi:hypothetical protein
MMTHTSEEVLSASGEVNRAQRDYWETDGPLQYQQFGDTNEALLGPPGEAMLDAPDLGAPGAPGPFAFADGDRLTQLLAGGGFRDVRLETLTQPFRIGRLTGEQAAVRRRPPRHHRCGRHSLHAGFAPYAGEQGVVSEATAWLVTARR